MIGKIFFCDEIFSSHEAADVVLGMIFFPLHKPRILDFWFSHFALASAKHFRRLNVLRLFFLRLVKKTGCVC